jgi:hypothetical protein
MNDSRVDQRIIAVLGARLREQLAYLRQRLEPLHRVTAVAMTGPIVSPGELLRLATQEADSTPIL